MGKSNKANRRAIHAAIMHEELGRQRWLAEHPQPNKPAPVRPWEKAPEAGRQPPWWGVQRLGPRGRFSLRAMHRHPTREDAEREAQFLAEYYPGGVFVVVEALSVHVTGEPEVKV